MAAKTVVAGSDVSAQQLKDFFRQIADRSINGPILQAVLEHRNPFALECNEHGHVVLTFAGLDLTGADEVERLHAAGYQVSEYAKSCFLSAREDSYDKRHRLSTGRVYKVALMPGREIECDADRTTANLRKRGMEHYGYGKPVAGFIPRVREVLSDKQMEELGIGYAAALHEPITDCCCDPSMFYTSRNSGGRYVRARCDGPGPQWSNDGAFVFPVSVS